jgi:transposase
MKSVHYLYEKIYLCRIMDEIMSPDSLSRMLSSLPCDQSIRVMKRLTENGEYILMDSTAVFSRSENVPFLELGHNSKVCIFH